MFALLFCVGANQGPWKACCRAAGAGRDTTGWRAYNKCSSHSCQVMGVGHLFCLQEHLLASLVRIISVHACCWRRTCFAERLCSVNLLPEQSVFVFTMTKAKLSLWRKKQKQKDPYNPVCKMKKQLINEVWCKTCLLKKKEIYLRICSLLKEIGKYSKGSRLLVVKGLPLIRKFIINLHPFN